MKLDLRKSKRLLVTVRVTRPGIFIAGAWHVISWLETKVAGMKEPPSTNLQAKAPLLTNPSPCTVILVPPVVGTERGVAPFRVIGGTNVYMTSSVLASVPLLIEILILTEPSFIGISVHDTRPDDSSLVGAGAPSTKQINPS
jgi:hypothetical protein